MKEIAQKNKRDYVTKEIMKALELLKTMWGGLNKRQGHVVSCHRFSQHVSETGRRKQKGIQKKNFGIKDSNI